MPDKFAYSYDREDYTGSYNSPEEALADAVRKTEGLASPPAEVFVGRLVQPDPQAQDHARQVINAMSQRAHVDFGESARRYLKNVTPEQAADLDQALEQTILAWLQRNRLMPTFVQVTGIREYPSSHPGPGPAARSGNNEVHTLGVGQMPQDMA